MDNKQQILVEIDGLRSDVGKNPKIRLRAQKEIFEFILLPPFGNMWLRLLPLQFEGLMQGDKGLLNP